MSIDRFSLDMINSRSLGMTIRVSTTSDRAAMPSSACLRRRNPSKSNGLVTTPTVSAPSSWAISATTGDPPVPVPPPMPAAMNTRSAPSSARLISSRSSSWHSRPLAGSPPTPSPRAVRSPTRIRIGTSERDSAWASVLTVMYSTSGIRSRYIRETAFEPPPPTPTTLIVADPMLSPTGVSTWPTIGFSFCWGAPAMPPLQRISGRPRIFGCVAVHSNGVVNFLAPGA